MVGQPGRVIYDWRHYLVVVQRKPGALRNGAPFVEMPEPFRMLQAKILRQPGGDREMVDILSLVLHHDEQAVLCAVEPSAVGLIKLQGPRTTALEPFGPDAIGSWTEDLEIRLRGEVLRPYTNDIL